jgi:hypothetical protein
MSTKKLRFRIDLQAVQGNDALVGHGALNVEIHRSELFFGLSVWHDDWERRYRNQPSFVLSRTGPFNPSRDFTSTDTPRYQVNTLYDADPLIAASRVLRWHLTELMPPVLGNGVAEGLNENPFYQATYGDRVIEPICTAVLGMCRDASLYQELADDERLWAIGTWTFKIVDDEERAHLLALGTQVQDVLVVRDNDANRRQINQALW